MSRLAIFDCDGTLVDGQAAICTAMDAAFDEAGLAPPDHHQVRRMVGLSLPQAILQLASNQDELTRQTIVTAYKQAFAMARQSGQLHEPLYDGIAELLEDLAQAGWQMAIATGKSDRGLAAMLQSHGLESYFISLQTADRHPSKPHPAMLEAVLFETSIDAQQAVMIGDTSYDRAMAQAAGVRAIGVDWGYHSAAELRDGGAEAVANTMQELKGLLQ